MRLFNKTTALAALAPLGLAAAAASADHVWINEFHYNTSSADTTRNDFVEVIVRSGQPFNAADTVVTLYDGNNTNSSTGGPIYNSQALSSFFVGTAFTASDGTTYTPYRSNFVTIQNGNPDGIALSTGGTLVEFLSYGGAFTGVGGPADGVRSTDVGLTEPNQNTGSIGRTGTGFRASDFTFAVFTADTRGAVNLGQTFTALPAVEVVPVVEAVPSPTTLSAGMLAGATLLRRRRV